MSRTILITGATGNQGGATIRALLATDTKIEILALTRNTDSAAAKRLAASSSNVKLVQGDLNDIPAIFAEVRRITNHAVRGVFSVQVPNLRNPSVEENHGKELIDVAIAADVKHFVYASVDRGGANSASTPSTLPFWATKHHIEHYLRTRTKGTSMRYTILRPTSFMEHFSNDFKGRLAATFWKSHYDGRPMNLIAVKDVGWFAAQVFVYPERYAQVEMSLVGDKLTFAQADQIYREKFGTKFPTTYALVAWLVFWGLKPIRMMLRWTRDNRDELGLNSMRKAHPQILDFGTWLVEESAFKNQQ